MDERAEDTFTRAALPVILQALGAATQELAAFNALLADGAPATFSEERLARIASSARTVEELGWLLGLCGAASGANTLLERHIPNALELVRDLARACLKEAGRDLAAGPKSLPELAPDFAHSWEVAWLFGAFLFNAGSALPQGDALAFELDCSAARLEVVAHASGARFDLAFALVCARLLPAARLTLTPTRAHLALPLEALAL
jgi:hypothetical protein